MRNVAALAVLVRFRDDSL